MNLSRTWRLFLIAALLLAQQSALAHQLWHAASGEARAAVAKLDDGKAAGGNPLCSLHAALGDVLGALDNAVPLFAQAGLSPDAVLPAGYSAASLAALAPSSRGPPASL